MGCIQLPYDIDIVMCIDATGSMGPFIDQIKANAITFHKDFVSIQKEKGRLINEVRVRVIAFRDYLADGENAMLMSDFFKLPEQIAQFEALVKGIEPMGGGDDPEDGLEALAYAIKSNWSRDGIRKRHIIIVWTDAKPHALGYGKEAPSYPPKMVKRIEELSAWWGVDQDTNSIMDRRAKRLIIFAPDEGYWNLIANCWDNVLLYPSAAGQGLGEENWDAILESLVHAC